MSARRIDPELPWGNWLRAEAGTRGHLIDDATGERWPSLRAALWNGRLSMQDYNRQPPPELLETMHAVLAAAVRRTPNFHEQACELFQGSEPYSRMFHLWLASQKLIVLAANGHGADAVTVEGMAVLNMLMATRPYDVRQERPTGATIAQLGELGLGPETREERLVRVEEASVGWDAAFIRQQFAGKPSIIMSKRGDGPAAAFQTVWTLRLANVEQRDRFFEWLCFRLDRWMSWAEMAHDYGSDQLTHHLLQVAAAALVDVMQVANHQPGLTNSA